MTDSSVLNTEELASEMILVGISDGDWCDIFRLSQDHQTTIGRASDNDIVIRSDRCSRQHAAVFCDNDEWFVRDLDSSNGTRLNRKRISGTAPLSVGDRIEIGRQSFEFTSGYVLLKDDIDGNSVDSISSHHFRVEGTTQFKSRGSRNAQE
ncbi:MAG: FHA domain-containing protein [Planctomycetota bacterium]|jgi:pSer/pThr/pTyr-binding forkhead associated (FHA) protein